VGALRLVVHCECQGFNRSVRACRDYNSANVQEELPPAVEHL